MAYEEVIQSITKEANADLSANQYFFMSINATGKVAPTGDGASADGVLQNNPNAAGRMASLGVSGVSMVQCGGAVTKGNDVASDANGAAVDVTTGDVILGVAQSAGVSGDIIPVLLTVQNRSVFA